MYGTVSNHDDRAAFAKDPHDEETSGPVNRSRQIGEVLFLLCDSSIPGYNEGLLESRRGDRRSCAGRGCPLWTRAHRRGHDVRGRPLLLAPGVISTARLPWATPGELTWAITADLDDAPMVAFHVLDDQRRLTTHFRNALALR